MPFPIMAVLSLVASKMAADQAAKQAAAQSATDAMNKPPPPPVNMQPVTLEGLDRNPGGDDDPFAGETMYEGGALPTGADQAMPGASSSAHARTLEAANSPLIESPEGVPPALSPDYTGAPQQPQVPQTQAGDTSGKMTGLEMAQLGLTLGSMLGKRKPGPGIPSLPGNDYPGMKPVFRG